MAMKKPNIKLDTAKLKRFFVQYVEKIVLGVVGLIFLMLLYGMYGIERFQKSPSDLRQMTAAAKLHVDGGQWDAEREGAVVKDYTHAAEEIIKNISAAGYEWEGVDPSVWPRGNKRGAPRYLPIEDLAVHVGRGAFTLKQAPPAGRGAQPQPPAEPAEDDKKADGKQAVPAPPAAARSDSMLGLRYAVLVGRVPLAKQIREFQQTFAGVASPREADQAPRYLGAVVERAEVTGGARDQDLKWVRIEAMRSKRKAMARFADGREELADKAAVNPNLCDPLPSRIGEEWEAEAVVANDIPLAHGKSAAPAAPVEAEPKPMPVAGEAEFGPDEPAPPANNAVAQPGAQAKKAEAKSHDLLFRYFDFGVEPGKIYKYRVQLVIDNPNLGVPKAQLVDPKLNEEKWGLPTAAISPEARLPFDGIVLAGDFMPAGSSTAEPGAQIGIEQWMPEGGSLAEVDLPVYRGQLANPTLDAVIRSAKGDDAHQSDKPVEFRTETAILDVFGPGREEPADILVLDATGRLDVLRGKDIRERFEDLRTRAEGIKEALDEQAAQARKDKKDKDRDPLDTPRARPGEPKTKLRELRTGRTPRP